MDTKFYAKKYLTQEIEAITTSDRDVFHSELTIYEKAIIYKYSSPDGYLEVNNKLHSNRGKNTTNFGKLLAESLKKLDNYSSIVYRKVDLNKTQQNIYKKALKNGTVVTEYAFVSTSKSKTLAMRFPGNTLFIINSKRGKDIEKIAKFGHSSSYNEYEVLFQPNSQFEVLEVDNNIAGLLIITMEEI